MAQDKLGPSLKPIYTKNRTIGLLGGSFNPAHEGHLHLTLEALKMLKLDVVWWLVSPQNPLKPASELAPYETRLQSAKDMITSHQNILVSDFEAKEHLFYSVDTLRTLQRRFPGTRFVWLMGADNLETFHRWRQWQKFSRLVPIAVFDRAPYSHTSIRSKAYQRLSRFLLKNNAIHRILPMPGLLFIHMKRHPLSSTALRKSLEKTRF